MERPEAEDFRKQAEIHHWYAAKWEKFKPALTAFLDLFPMIREVDDDWRRDVFCGRAEFDERMDQVVRGLYALWLIYSRMFKEKTEFNWRGILPVPPVSFLSQTRVISTNIITPNGVG